MINSHTLVEDLAEHLYKNHNNGESLKRPWQADSGLQLQLDEYEREEYREMARAALGFLEQRFKP